MLSAPAGFGKTSLLAQWMASPDGSGLPVAWVDLEPEDDDPLRFWELVITALHGLPLSHRKEFSTGSWIASESLSLIHCEIPPQLPLLLATLLTEMAAIPERFVLVLDHYQSIQSEAINQGLSFFLEHLPTRARLIVATRADPLFPLARWRTRNILAEIRLADLRFTDEEARQVYSQMPSPPIPDELVSLLVTRAEGWIAGIRLSQLAFQGCDTAEADRLLTTLESNRGGVLEQLLDSFLQCQPVAVRTFLLQTSILNHFNPELASAVVQEEPLEEIQPTEKFSLSEPLAILNLLQGKSLITHVVDNDQSWYYYPPLLSELLQSRLQSIRPGLGSWLHRRAAGWLEEHGQIEEALVHAREARDLELAADIFERNLHLSGRGTDQHPTAGLWTTWQPGKSVEWLNQLSENQLSARPWLRLYIYQYRSPVDQMFTGDKYLSQTEQVLLQRPELAVESGQLLALIYEARARLAINQSDPHLAVTYAQKAINSLPQGYVQSICQAYLTLGTAQFWLGDLVSARQAIGQAASQALSSGLRHTAIASGYALAELQLSMGQISQAIQTCQRTEPLGTYAGRIIPGVGWLRLIEAEVAFQRNDLAEAVKLARAGLDLLEHGQLQAHVPDGYALLALIHQTSGDIEGANVAIQSAIEMAYQTQEIRLISRVEACQARIWLAQQDYLRAFPWAEKYRSGARTDYRRDFEDLTLVRSLMANDQAEEALSRLDALLALARRAAQLSLVIELLVLRALAVQMLGGQPKALDNLGQALLLAEPEGMLRVFLHEGYAMQVMILALREQLKSETQGIEGDRAVRLLAFIDRLLALFPPPQPGPTRQITGTGQTGSTSQDKTLPVGQTTPLNAREEAILGLLSQGMSNREIAQKLFLSANTLRAYTVSLFNKLGVTGRADAVARARQNGLLPPTPEDQK